MAESLQKSLCPRLIDYLAIVGARSSSTRKGAGSNQSPVQVSLIFHLIFDISGTNLILNRSPNF